MKSKILLFLSLITYTLTEAATTVTVSSVATGACKDNKYTFVIKANADGDLAAGSATVTLASPENTTPTCTFAAVGTAQSSDNTGTNTGDNTGTNTDDNTGTNTDDNTDTNTDDNTGTNTDDNTGTNTDDNTETNTEDNNGSRRLATGDFDISCTITSKLDQATIKVNSVVIGTITATGTPLEMNEKATCEGSSDTTTPYICKFIQISGFLFLLILTAF